MTRGFRRPLRQARPFNRGAEGLVLMPPPRYALSLALRGRGVRLGGACRGDDSFPYTDEGHPPAAKNVFRGVDVAVVSTPALTTHPQSYTQPVDTGGARPGPAR